MLTKLMNLKSELQNHVIFSYVNVLPKLESLLDLKLWLLSKSRSVSEATSKQKTKIILNVLVGIGMSRIYLTVRDLQKFSCSQIKTWLSL